MSVDTAQAALDEVAAKIEGGDTTEETLNRFEELEGELKREQKADEILKRNAAYKSVATPALNTASSAKDDTLERAFTHYLRTGQENQDITELRSQTVGTATAGGYTVPDGFRNKLVDRMKAFGGLSNVVENVTTDSGQPLEWPTLDDTADTNAGIVAETGTLNAGADLVFGTATLGAYKYMSGGASNAPLKVSFELAQDSAIDIESLVAAKLGQRIARFQAPHWVKGTGSGQPKGIVTGRTPVATTALSYTELLDVVHAVDPAYRESGSCRWAFSDDTLRQVRAITDPDTGRPILTDGNLGDSLGGTRLLGFPVTIDQAFSNYAAGSATAAGVFGDLNEGYVIRRVREITVLVNPYSSQSTGQIEYMAWARADGTQQNVNSYVTFSGTV